MLKSHIIKLAALAALGMPLTASAGQSAKETKPMIQETTTSCITGDLGVNFVSEYISRGIVFENQGVIGQPYLDLYFGLYKGDGFVNAVSLNLGLWSSINSHKVTESSTSSWYEFDYTAGLAVTFAKNFTLTTSYFEFTSPSDAFTTARSINLNLAYNDSELLGAFALKPHVAVLFEVDGHAGTAGDGAAGGANGIYYEFGIAPSVALIKEGSFPVTLTIPVNVGFGNNSFYASSGYGYVSAGLNVAVGLGFVPKCYGTWTANVGATYYNLEHANQLPSADSDENRVVFSGGVGMTF